MMVDIISPFTDYAFMRKALVSCVLLSLGSAPLGVLLMLRRMSLMGEAMSHAVLPGVAAGFVVAGLSVPAMSIGGLAAGVIVAILVGLVTRHTTLKEDANLASFYLIALALGVILISLKGNTIDLMHLLFGSVLAIDSTALNLVAGVVATTVTVLAIAYRPLIIEAFDPIFLQSLGRRNSVYHLLFLILVVLNLVAGFQTMGTLMTVGLMMLPAAAARFWAQRFLSMASVAVGIGILASIGGLLFSYFINVPSGPAIILVAGGMYILSLLFGRWGSIRARYFPFKHLQS